MLCACVCVCVCVVVALMVGLRGEIDLVVGMKIDLGMRMKVEIHE